MCSALEKEKPASSVLPLASETHSRVRRTLTGQVGRRGSKQGKNLLPVARSPAWQQETGRSWGGPGRPTQNTGPTGGQQAPPSLLISAPHVQFKALPSAAKNLPRELGLLLRRLPKPRIPAAQVSPGLPVSPLPLIFSLSQAALSLTSPRASLPLGLARAQPPSGKPHGGALV